VACRRQALPRHAGRRGRAGHGVCLRAGALAEREGLPPCKAVFAPARAKASCISRAPAAVRCGGAVSHRPGGPDRADLRPGRSVDTDAIPTWYRMPL